MGSAVDPDAGRAFANKDRLRRLLWITVLGSGPTLLALVITASALLWSGGGRAYLRPLRLVYLGVKALT